MHSDERRKAIADVLHAADAPVSASALAEKFSVSRQIIVGDIALLRSSGEEILATPRGYVTPKEARGIPALAFLGSTVTSPCLTEGAETS